MLKKRLCILSIVLSLLLVVGGNALAQGGLLGSSTRNIMAATSAPAYTRALKRGCRGADVKALQQKLKELGFYNSTVDGVFGRGTENAVKTFQRAHSLKADGIVGRATYSAIYGTSTPPTGDSGSSGGDVDGYTLGKLDNEVTLRKGSKGSNVKDLQAVLKIKGFYSGPINGNFLAQTKNSVMSFQHSVGLDSDGVAGNYTLSALYTMLNPPDLGSITPWPAGRGAYSGITVEKLQWSTASNVFARSMNAVVVDVRSGYIFNVRRTGGTNHADVETITPLDTATFYKCDGNFSWDRRPIWVIVNGRRLAASMNCMPHGYDTLPDNDFKGQFCIHFVNSRTHGTNRVDPQHQACIEEAYQAGLADSANPPTASPSSSASPSPTASTSPTASASATPTVSPSPTPPPEASEAPDPPPPSTGDTGGGQMPPP
jgi:peptidoglycan hydrolase-like protein with peptidoglycan-binding domain